MDRRDERSRGLHHVTTIIGDAQRASVFYTQVMGLNRVKKTVCYDDPGSYHLYFGDATGSPGTVVSTLAWNCVAPGLIGAGEVVQTAFRIAPASLALWREKLRAMKIPCRVEESPFGDRMLCIADPDGTAFALIETADVQGADAARPQPAGSEVLGLHGVTLNVRERDATIDILQDVFGFETVRSSGDCIRLTAHDGAGGTLTLRIIGRSSRGRLGGGTIRHVALRARDVDDRAAMIETLRATYGIAVSEPIARTYLNAVGFRAPCGVLFEIATDGPGFAVDEAPDRLGRALKLPAFLEDRRLEVESLLPPLA